MKRFLCLGTVVALLAICVGCGETFRPIIIPNPQQFPNPQASHTVVTVNDNGPVVNGSAMVIDVSGDADFSNKNVGLRPVHAVQQTASQVLVVNQSVSGVAADSVTKLAFSGESIASASTITLPSSYDQSGNQATSAANFVATTESSEAYVSLPQYQPNPAGGAFVPSLAVINTAKNSVAATIPVGTTPAANPVAIAETLDAQKLYVANQGDGTISAFNTSDHSAREVCVNGSCPSPPDYTPIPLSSPPIWLSARLDSQRVYVLEQDGTLAYMDTTSTAGPDNLYESYLPETVQVPDATYMWYDMILNRLYIPGEVVVVVNGEPQLQSGLAIVDVSQSAPDTLATVPVPEFTPLNQAEVPATAIAVTSLPDGSRAYLASVPSSPDMSLPSQLTISSVSGDATTQTATYTYTLTAGQNLTPGVTVTISGLFSGSTELTDFEGTFPVSNVLSGTTACPTACFQTYNPNALSATAVSGSAAGENIFPQVTVVNTTSNTANPIPIAIPGFAPYDAFCSPSQNSQAPRFRMTMAAAGDSTRVYLASCDGGMVNLIDTATDTYILNVPAPYSVRPPASGSTFNPPQNPVFMIAGP